VTPRRPCQPRPFCDSVTPGPPGSFVPVSLPSLGMNRPQPLARRCVSGHRFGVSTPNSSQPAPPHEHPWVRHGRATPPFASRSACPGMRASSPGAGSWDAGGHTHTPERAYSTLPFLPVESKRWLCWGMWFFFWGGSSI